MSRRGQAAGASPPVRANALDALLAGLQAGMAGTLCMLAWLGSAQRLAAPQLLDVGKSDRQRLLWRQRRPRAASAGSTVSGTGAVPAGVQPARRGLFALVFAPAPGPQVRVLLLGLAFSMGWYYLSFHVAVEQPGAAAGIPARRTPHGAGAPGVWHVPLAVSRLIGDQGARIGDQEAQLPALEGAPGAADTPPANSDNHLREP